MIVLKIPLNRPPAHLPSNRSLVGFFLPCHLPFPALPRVPRAPSLRKEQPRSTGPPPLTRLDSVKWRVTCRISLFPSPAQCYTDLRASPGITSNARRYRHYRNATTTLFSGSSSGRSVGRYWQYMCAIFPPRYREQAVRTGARVCAPLRERHRKEQPGVS
jgi:hypothetical protein